jgi:hypothetical protein
MYEALFLKIREQHADRKILLLGRNLGLKRTRIDAILKKVLYANRCILIKIKPDPAFL